MPRMLWWFEREGLRTSIEVLHLANGEFELRIIDSDGIERVETFTSATELASANKPFTRSWQWADGLARVNGCCNEIGCSS